MPWCTYYTRGEVMNSLEPALLLRIRLLLYAELGYPVEHTVGYSGTRGPLTARSIAILEKREGCRIRVRFNRCFGRRAGPRTACRGNLAFFLLIRVDSQAPSLLLFLASCCPKSSDSFMRITSHSPPSYPKPIDRQ